MAVDPVEVQVVDPEAQVAVDHQEVVVVAVDKYLINKEA
jgi:hypothetical protein